MRVLTGAIERRSSTAKKTTRNGKGYDFLHRRPFGPEMIFDYQSSARKTHRRGIGPNT